MNVFNGLSAFPITPADETGRVDIAAIRRLARRLTDAGVDSIGLLGSTGSYPYLSRGERRRAIDAAVEEVGNTTPLIVGIGALRTDEVVALAKDAKAIGASAGLLSAMSYLPLSQDEVYEHFAQVAAQTDLPICIYDNPGTTHFRFPQSWWPGCRVCRGSWRPRIRPLRPRELHHILRLNVLRCPRGFPSGTAMIGAAPRH